MSLTQAQDSQAMNFGISDPQLCARDRCDFKPRSRNISDEIPMQHALRRDNHHVSNDMDLLRGKLPVAPISHSEQSYSYVALIGANSRHEEADGDADEADEEADDA